MRDEAGPVRLKTRGKNRKSIIRMRIIIAANRKGKRLFQQQLQKSSAQTVPPSAQQKRGGPFASDGFFGIAAAGGGQKHIRPASAKHLRKDFCAATSEFASI